MPPARARLGLVGPLTIAATILILGPVARGEGEDDLRARATAAMRKAAGYFREHVASHGGYVYHYTLDLDRRWGEGEATRDQVWVQPPGTPRVGLAYLEAYEATGDTFYLDAARDAAGALMYGQLASGGWTNAVDFDPRGPRVALYRNGKGRGRNFSTLDDGITQAAARLLMHLDRALKFRDAEVHEAARVALDALLAAQFPSGGFPQGWDGPVEPMPALSASYPEHDWRTEGRIKNYWDMPTLNDGLAGTVARTLIDAHTIYGDDRYRAALARLGDFLIRAQMPDPQPAWAQQYNPQMQPIWARKFEPAAITAGESQDVLRTLLLIHEATGDPRYLEPIPRSLAYLETCLLPDGRLARYYELRTNRPLYMERHGAEYTLTYDDANLPAHYAFKVASGLPAIARAYEAARQAERPPAPNRPPGSREPTVRAIVESLDDQGRWVSRAEGDRLPGQLNLAPGTPYIASELFIRNLETLSAYVAATAGD